MTRIITKRIIEDFAENPWDGVNMPEGFNPDNNPFLNPKINRPDLSDEEAAECLESAIDFIEQVKRSGFYFSDGEKKGLVARSIYPDGTRPSDFADVEGNSLWSMLLNAAGYDAASEVGVHDVFSMTAANARGVQIFSWYGLGLLDYGPDRREKAVSLADSLSRYSKEEHPDKGLVNENGTAEAHANTLWGLFLHKLGYDKDGINAEKVKDGIKFELFDGATGLVIEDPNRTERKSMRDCVLYGLLLHATNDPDAAKVEERIRKQAVGLENIGGKGIGYAVPEYVGSLEPWSGFCSAYTNALAGLFMRARGDHKFAHEIIKGMNHLFKSDDKGFLFDKAALSGGLGNIGLEPEYFEAKENMLYGLLQLKDGFKVFMGGQE